MDTFTDQQIISEMLKRFIVPKWYTREHIEDKCEGFTKDQVDEVIERIMEDDCGNIDHYVDCCIDDVK